MKRSRPRASRLALSFLAALAAPATAQDPGGEDPGAQAAPIEPGAGLRVDREAMWFAPTAEDWRKPVLIPFQRTWDDALAVARATKRPILICVNMDGEIASEHYAGVRYRQPDIAALYRPYVCVIASVYRHNPRDYDEAGNRILCPRFGSVTCGEHVAIEPLLYERFFDGRRIAPRHICIELDGAETYDVFYAFDTASVFQAVREGTAQRELGPDEGGDRPLAEALASRDARDRAAAELAYVQGDAAARRTILQEAMKHRDLDQLDLLRLALFGFDVELARLARRALVQSTTESAIDLISEALRVPMEPEERELLIAALERLGETWPRGKTLAAVHRGLGARSEALDAEAWSATLAEAQGEGPWTGLESRVERELEESAQREGDPAARLELAEAYLALAIDSKTASTPPVDARSAPKYAELLLEDARRIALQAEELGASGWRVDAAVALAAYYGDEREEAFARAEKAVAALPPGEYEWNAMAVLGVFAEGRRSAIRAALRAKEEWPPQWLADVHAAYSVIARHPFGTDSHVAAHHDFLRALGAEAQASSVLDAGLARFPVSPALHDRLRARILAERGPSGLSSAYDELLARPDAAPDLEWFAGYAALVAAEFHRRASQEAEALAAYDRALDHYETSAASDAEHRESADHYAAIALAGQARLAYERGDWRSAVDLVLASFARRPQAAATLDGLNFSPVDTAKMLLARLNELELHELAAEVRAALERLDPELLKLPAFERELPDGGTDGRARRRRDRSGG